MRALLDINVLIALLDSDHALHERAREWFGRNASRGWASCPMTQNGCVRVMAHPGYANALPIAPVMERLREATRSAYHEFWADDVSLLDPRVADASRIHRPRQLTDFYLLALAEIVECARRERATESLEHLVRAEATTAGIVRPISRAVRRSRPSTILSSHSTGRLGEV